MNISKKKLKQIDSFSCYDEILRKYGYTFTDFPPNERWDKQHKELFDMLTEVEDRTKNEIKNIISNKKKIK